MQTNCTSSTAWHRIKHGIKSKLSCWTTILVQTTANFINQVSKSSDQSGPHGFLQSSPTYPGCVQPPVVQGFGHKWLWITGNFGGGLAFSQQRRGSSYSGWGCPTSHARNVCSWTYSIFGQRHSPVSTCAPDNFLTLSYGPMVKSLMDLQHLCSFLSADTAPYSTIYLRYLFQDMAPKIVLAKSKCGRSLLVLRKIQSWTGYEKTF